MAEEDKGENDNAASSTASGDNDNAASSTVDGDEQQAQAEGEIDQEETDPLVITRKTQKRMDVLTSKIADRDATIADRDATIDTMSRGSPLEFEDKGPPNRDDFEDDDVGFATATAEYNTTKKVVSLFNANRERDQGHQAAESADRKLSSYADKVDEIVKEEIPDFRTVIQGSGNLLQSQDASGNLTPAALAILEVPNGPKVAYHVATNPAIARALNRATPLQVATTIGRLSAELFSAKSVTVTKHPPPIGSEDGAGGSAAVSGDFPFSEGATFK